jgi:hypothetical protein
MTKKYGFVNGTPVEAHPDDCDCERCERCEDDE